MQFDDEHLKTCSLDESMESSINYFGNTQVEKQGHDGNKRVIVFCRIQYQSHIEASEVRTQKRPYLLIGEIFITHAEMENDFQLHIEFHYFGSQAVRSSSVLFFR